MQKKLTSESGLFNLRVTAAVALCLLGASLGWLAFAATPSSGTLDPNNTVLTYQAGPLLVPNQTPAGLGQLDKGPRCNSQFPCDSYTLTVNLPPGYMSSPAHCNAFVKVSLSWVDTGSGQSDYDLYIFKGNPNVNGSLQADYQSASGADPEVATILPLQDGTTTYTIDIVPYQPTGETLHVRAEFFPGSGPCGAPGFGSADPTVPGNPRYINYDAPIGSSAEPSNGEFNIGFNAGTGRIMLMNSGPVWRLTTPDRLVPALPECCEGLWEDVDNLTTIVGLDPILWTTTPFTIPDPNNPLQTITTARTFSSNSTAGTNGVYGYTDDDGNTWNNVSFSPPNASSDHETIGSGPYPAPLNLAHPPSDPVTHGNAVYYCAQTFPTGAAACQRSDTLGASYGPSTLIYNPNGPDVPLPTPTPSNTIYNTQCRGIHGHVHVAPDGTVYVPVRECLTANPASSNAGLVVSTDGGITWTEHVVPNSTTQTHGSDPSIAIGANNTAYFFYVRDETPTPQDPTQGHIHVQVSTDRGATWTKDHDLGASHGILNAVFPEAVAGDDNRAACGFLATDRPGDYEGPHFPGVWYLFIATTYDGGDNWTVVNATPNDPVQGKIGVWQGGGSPDNRNLLDFNEVTKDDKGRVLFGYDDGCVGDCVADPAQASYGARMRVARQSGGKGLLSAFDNQTDTTTALTPKAPCLSGTRDTTGSHLEWKVPDNGGSDILYYEIWRSTTSGTEVKIADTSQRGPTTKFDDNTADPNVPDYFYIVKAKNAATSNGGVGAASNELDLQVAVIPPAPIESACVIPGLTKLIDPPGDTSVTVIGLTPTPAPPGSDLLSFQLSQPYQADGVPRLVFLLNTDNGQSPQAPYSAWYVSMQIPDASQPSGFRYKAVHLFWNGTTPVFESYTPSTSTAGTTDGRFAVAGSQLPAEPGSSYDAPYNQVKIIVKASDLGLAPGDKISGFVAGVAQSTAAGTPTALYDQMPDSLGYANSYVVNFNGVCAPMSPGVVSRMVHGSANFFDISLPTSGSTGAIEPRSGGTNSAYTLIYTFANNLSFIGAPTVTQGSANIVSTTIGPNLNQVTVKLNNVTNAQHLIMTLSGMKDASDVTLPSVAAHMDLLVGDTNADSFVDSADIAQTKSETGHSVTNSNFREDLNADGFHDSADIALVKSKSGSALPGQQATTSSKNPKPSAKGRPGATK